MYDSDEEKGAHECDFKRRRHQEWVNTRKKEHRKQFEANRKRIAHDGANPSQLYAADTRSGSVEEKREHWTESEWAR